MAKISYTFLIVQRPCLLDTPNITAPIIFSWFLFDLVQSEKSPLYVVNLILIIETSTVLLIIKDDF